MLNGTANQVENNNIDAAYDRYIKGDIPRKQQSIVTEQGWQAIRDADTRKYEL